MIPMKYWIKGIVSVEDFTEQYTKMKNKQPKEPVLKITVNANCFGTLSTETRYFTLSEWNNIRRIGCFIG